MINSTSLISNKNYDTVNKNSNFFDNENNTILIIQPHTKDILKSSFQFQNKTNKKTNTKIQLIFHHHAIFGSYCLEDVRCIAMLVEKYKKINSTNIDCIFQKKIKYDCFNYEDAASIKSSNNDLKNIFESNIKILNKENIELSIHYDDKCNDLMEDHTFINKNTKNRKREYIENVSNWNKFQRKYKDVMVFFNPYMNGEIGTTNLLQSFFKYAKFNLCKKGVVILQWNPQRPDFTIDIMEIAAFSKFKCVKKLSGLHFQQLTDFKHTKNSDSLIKNKKRKIQVSPKPFDTIYIFNKTGLLDSIKKTNIIVMSMIELLDEQNNSI